MVSFQAPSTIARALDMGEGATTSKKHQGDSAPTKKRPATEPAEVLRDLSMSVKEAFSEAKARKTESDMWCGFLAKKLEGLEEEDRDNLRLTIDTAVTKIKRGEMISFVLAYSFTFLDKW